MRKSFFTILISLIACTLTNAQTFKEFSTREAFLTELQQEIVEKSIGDAKKDNKELIDKFTEMWVELNSFTPDQQRTIYNTSNEILKNKLKVIPDVRDYIKTITIITEAENSSQFNEWHRTLDYVINSKTAKKDFGDYITFSENLFADSALFTTGSVSWVTDNLNYRFEIHDNQPQLVVPQLSLACKAKGSSTVILNTSGVLLPLEGTWTGKNGTITWEKAGLDPNKVYAIINDYRVQMKFANFEADSATFFNTDYFDTPLLGKIEDKVQIVATEDRSSFPEFKSYSQRLKISNIDQNVDYEGGFVQKGARFIASGTDENPAYLTFYLDEKPFLIVSSLSFSIKEDRILSIDAAVKFKLHEDSIVHPGLDFKYFRDKREVNLFRMDAGLQKAPYFDSYHQIDIHAESVTWQIDKPKILFGTIPNSSDKKAFFESDYYFRENRFDQMLGLSMNHPLVEVKNCFVQRGSDQIWDTDVAKCIHASKVDAQVLLLTFAQMGLVSFNPKTGKVYAKPRMYHYVSAKSEKEDYDVIQISSDIGSMENASLDLVDEVYTLKINGINNITLSDSHSVVLFPKDGTITMKKNRDFDFSGVIQAGRLEFFGNNYQFLYDEFKIEMPMVDSVRLTVSTGDESKVGAPKLKKVKTVIENLNATLEIDNPKNKSGLEELEQYPIFTSHDSSFAYYERSRIHRKAYKRENFHFELDPFVFDSLDNFGNDRIKFDGVFRSADIFPEFREKLTLQEDYSLGFIRQAPPEGYEVYRGKAKFFNTIKMSHEGLEGSGTLKYLTSTTKSDDFLFLPEQMRTVAQSFVVEEQMGAVQFPPVSGTNVKQSWRPYDDLLRSESTKEPFVMYDGSTMDGILNLSPEHLMGNGLFSFEKAELESDEFVFAFSDFRSDTADFRLKSDISAFDGFQFKTNNVSAKIDFAKRKGDFISNGGTSKMEFPVNQYIAYMDRFTWLMDDDAIELSGGKSQKSGGAGTMQFEGSRFISVHPEQDSLEFYSPAAKYDIKNNIIKAREVEYIPVADALIYPDSGQITILKKAKMKSLTNSQIMANSVTKYHRIDSATIDIFARRDYVATGLYTYRDLKGAKQLIRFSTVAVDSTFQTYAKGEIVEERNFTLSPYFDFKGNVRLEANTKELTFTGYSKIHHLCEANVPLAWFQFSSSINPDDVFIPISDVILNEESEKLSTAIVLDQDTGSIYTSFLSAKASGSHIDLLPATGFLQYHEESGEYRISNTNKLVQQSLPGQYLSLNSSKCLTYGEGKFKFGINPGSVTLSTVGNVKHDILTNKVDLDLMMLVDFFFENKLIDDMGKVLAENAVGDPTDFERETYQRGLRELLGADAADKLISAITLTGQFKRFPEELEKHMFLTQVKMKWNPETDSYQSVGKIGVGNIGKRQVNVQLNGKVEVVVGRAPEINIYLEADKDTWYYFKYSKNVMQAFSSVEEFNTTISDLKADKRKLKTEKGQAPYSYMLSSKRRKDDFIAKF